MQKEPYEKPKLVRHRTLKEITLLSFESRRVEEIKEEPGTLP